MGKYAFNSIKCGSSKNFRSKIIMGTTPNKILIGDFRKYKASLGNIMMFTYKI